MTPVGMRKPLLALGLVGMMVNHNGTLMNFRLLQTLGQIGQAKSGSAVRVSNIPIVKSSGSLRMRHFELNEYTQIEIEADVDLVWRPGAPKARLRLRESLMRHLHIEHANDVLRITSPCDFEGERPMIDVSSSALLQVHVGARANANLFDILNSSLIVSAFDRSHLRIQGHSREIHVECRQDACIDCASLICDIAIADLSGDSTALLRAESALQAETRDNCHLLTIGSPRILDVARLGNRS